MALESGTRVGIYGVTAKIGEGAMGEVYRALDTTLDRDVALKVLPEAFTADPERLARFQREAKVLASLNHPNIGGIYGIETSGETQALVLELIEGPTLAERIADGPIPVEQAVPMVRQIAEALSAAHDAGIIHRDLKPANIKVRSDGTVKVLDFGLAKAAEGRGGEAADAPTMTAMSSQAGAVVGTAAYMAPEQARGEAVDKRADIWALGCVCYELLSGHRPFEGRTMSDTLASVLAREVDLTRLPEEVPAALHKFMARCLEKEPMRRLRDAAEGVLQLEEGLAQPVVEPAEAAAGRAAPLQFWQRPVSAAVAVITALVFGGLAVGIAVRTEPVPGPGIMRFGVTASEDAPLRSHPFVNDLVISGDGTQIAYYAQQPGGPGGQIYLRPIDQLIGAPLRGTEDGMGPFVSSDGAWIGFVSDGGSLNSTLKKVSLFGGPPVTLAESPTPINGASWSVDDEIIYGSFRSGLFRVSGGGGEPEALTTTDQDQGETSHQWPFIIPGRDAVVFTISGGLNARTSGQLAVLELDSGQVKKLGLAGFSPRYVSTGHLVYGSGDGSVRAVPFDVTELEVAGNPVPLIEGVSGKNTGAANFSVSDSGRLVYASGSGLDGGESSMVWVDREGLEEPLNLPPNTYLWPRVSPDGTRVAMVVGSADNGDVWVSELARGTLTNLTTDPANDRLPLWTLDGERVAFASDRGDRQEGVFSKLADGTGPVESLLTVELGFLLTPWDWSSDGQTMLFSYVAGDDSAVSLDVGVLQLEGNSDWEPLLQTTARETAPSISPNGNWLAYISDQTGRYEVYVERFPELGERRQISTSGGTSPKWSPTGRELFYRRTSNDGSMMSVSVDFEPVFTPGIPKVLFEGNYIRSAAGGGTTGGRQYDVSPDGGRFLMVRLTRAIENVEGSEAPITVVLNWFEELKERVPVP